MTVLCRDYGLARRQQPERAGPDLRMKALALIAIVAGCGRIGFDGPAARDGASSDGPSDGTNDGSANPVDGPPGGAATVTYLGSTSTVQDLATYTFNGISIGPPAANRIVVVSAFLGGVAVTPITSITVNASQLTLTGQIVDTINGGSIAMGYRTIPTGATAAITVTSANADRAAITVYNITALSEAPTEESAALDGNLDTSSIGSNTDLRAGEVVIANVGHGANTATWTWGGTWLNYTEVVDTRWSELGGYTSAAATANSDGLRSIQATPSTATQKLYNVATWR